MWDSKEKHQPPHVLLMEKDAQQFELYCQIIQEVSNCKIDLLNEVENFLPYLDRFNYHLVILSETQNSLILLEQLKRVSPTTSVIVISSKASVEEAVLAMRLGAEDYLSKPFNVDLFQLAVKRSLDRKIVFGDDSGMSQFLHLLNSCQLMSSAFDRSKIFEIIQSYFVHELSAGFSSIYTFEKGQVVKMSPSDTSVEQQDRMLSEILDISLRASNALEAIESSKELYRFVDAGHLTPSLFVYHFKWSEQENFFCTCLSPKRPLLMDQFENRVKLLDAQIRLASKNIEEYRGVQQLVYVDDVTGLYNTRYLNYLLEREIHQAELLGKSFAVLFLDADKFKAINDTHGHLVGTKLLHELGSHLKKYVRETDTVFRYGGDEFVAVLSPSDLSTAREVAERIRESVSQNEFLKSDGLSIHFTVSIGVALFPEHAKTLKDIIACADHAMYAAKNQTRNSVSIAEKVDGAS